MQIMACRVISFRSRGLAPVAPSFSSQQPQVPSGCDDYVFVKRGGGGVNCDDDVEKKKKNFVCVCAVQLVRDHSSNRAINTVLVLQTTQEIEH